MIPLAGALSALTLTLAVPAAAQTLDPTALILADEAPNLVPTQYRTLAPPAGEGAAMNDPVFETPILRLTDARAQRESMITHDYARASALNDDDTLVLVHDGGQFMLYSSAGKKLTDLPGVAGRYAEPRWLPGRPHEILYLSGNRVMRMDVGTLRSTEVARFPEYDLVYSGGEQDVSEDGDHFALMGSKSGRAVEAFILRLSTGQAGPRLDLRNVGNTVNWVAASHDLDLVVGWNPPYSTARYRGVEVYDSNMRFVRQLVAWMAHGDLCRDGNGDAVLVQSNAPSPAPHQNSHWLVSHRIRDGRETYLQRLTWEQVPHVSCNQRGPSSRAVVSLYVPYNPSASRFVAFDNEIYLLALDGSREVRRLAHHRSVPQGSYFYESRASESRSGRYIVFASNFGKSLTGSADYTDTYLLPKPVNDGPIAASHPVPPPPPSAKGGTVVASDPGGSGAEGGAPGGAWGPLRMQRGDSGGCSTGPTPLPLASLLGLLGFVSLRRRALPRRAREAQRAPRA